MQREAEAGPAYALRNEVSAEYFATLGVRVVRGRTFTAHEVRSAAPVAVISASLARRFWPDEEPLGSGLERIWGPADAADAPPAGFLRKPPGTTVIGIVEDTVTRFGSHDAPAIYLPLSASTVQMAQLVASTHGDPQPVTRRITDALASVDPNLRPTAHLVRALADRELQQAGSVAAAAGLLSATAVFLAVPDPESLIPNRESAHGS